MLSNNASFQLFNDENATLSMNPMISSSTGSSSVIKKRLGLGNHNINNNNNNNNNNSHNDNDLISATPSKVSLTTTKSNRKALVDLTHSQVNTRATPGRPLLQQHQQQQGLGLKKLIFKNDTNNLLNNNSSSSSSSSIIMNSSKKVTISEPDIPIDDMICSRLHIDEDPYDKVQRMAAQYKFTLNPSIELDKHQSILQFDEFPQELTKEELLLLEDNDDPFKSFNTLPLPCNNDNLDFLLE